MHSFWFALQRNEFILNPPNSNAFFSSLLIKIPYSGFPKPRFSYSAPTPTHLSHKNKLFLQATSVSANLLPHALSIVHACRLTLSTQFDRMIIIPNTMKEKKPVNNGQKKDLANFFARSFCDSDRIQTCNLLIRSQMLYSVELRSHFLIALQR